MADLMTTHLPHPASSTACCAHATATRSRCWGRIRSRAAGRCAPSCRTRRASTWWTRPAGCRSAACRACMPTGCGRGRSPARHATGCGSRRRTAAAARPCGGGRSLRLSAAAGRARPPSDLGGPASRSGRRAGRARNGGGRRPGHALRGLGAERAAGVGGGRLQRLGWAPPPDAAALGAGVWELFVPGVAAGALYKYELVGPDGALLP